MGDKANRESKSGIGFGRRWLIAPVVALAVMFGAPAAAQAADGVSFTNSNNTTANGQTLSFGTTPQGLLPVSQTVYLWTNQNSGGFLNGSRRHVGATVTWPNSAYEYVSASGGSGSRNCGVNSSSAG
jgi:hypothetical protein